MVTTNTLDHLLEVEAEAAALVSDAQQEADRRLRENDEKNRAALDEKIRKEIHNKQLFLNEEIKKIKIKYNKALDDYRGEISKINSDAQGFSALLNKFLSEG